MASTRRLFRRIRQILRVMPSWIEFTLLGILAAAFVTLGAAVIWAAVMPIPTINNFENRQVAQSTKIFDRTGNIVLYDVHGAMRRTAVPIEEISPYIRNATIAIEDDTFYTNAGFRPLALMRAVWTNITRGELLSGQGGSTITQQVVKNSLLTQEKTIPRKVKEIILALRLTRVYTKDQILNTYLNETPYGGTIYGIEEASQYFFGVPAKDVDLAQAAYLAALPQAPTYFSPYGNHRAALDARKNLVLARMRESNFITQEEYDQAFKENVEFNNPKNAGIKAPHFVFFIQEYLEGKYGADAVSQEGLRVVTTLDYDLQQKAEASVSKFAPVLLQTLNASNQGVVAVDPKTGQILAMVGSKGYFDDTIDGKVNIAVAKRQPGSSFKPFVYATAFKKGYTPETVVFDLQTQFSTACAPTDTANGTYPCYSPTNFDGGFEGPMTLRAALARSENIPAIKVLYLSGIRDSIETAQDLGITTLTAAPEHYGLPLVLGGGEVSLLEMTGAYSVFANDGKKNPPTGILRVEDASGRVLEEYEEHPTQMLEPRIARLINSILADNVARSPEFGLRSPLYFADYDVAAKTGTTNDFRDAWIIGYTPGIAVGAWTGNNDNSSMINNPASFIVAPMWHDFMVYALSKYSSPSENFPAPGPEADITSLPSVLAGNWNTDPSQGVHDILYWVNKDNPRSGRPANPASDPQFAYWEYPVSLWASGQPVVGSTTPPQASAFVQGGAPAGFRIASPQAGARLPFGAEVTFGTEAAQPQTILSVSYFANGALIGTSGQPPYLVYYRPAAAGTVTLRAVAQHTNGTIEEQSSTFSVE